MSSAQVRKSVALLAATYPVPAWNEQQLRAYCTLLADVDGAVLESVVVDWCRSERERPAVADLRRRVAQHGTERLAPEEAWEFVVRCFTRVGRYGVFPETHRLVARAVEAMGGWQALCASENLVADRAHFLRLYAGLQDADEVRAARTPKLGELPPGGVPIAPLIESVGRRQA